jgi:hypothetical protein
MQNAKSKMQTEPENNKGVKALRLHPSEANHLRFAF